MTFTPSAAATGGATASGASKIETLQVLRAIAAYMVVIDHTADFSAGFDKHASPGLADWLRITGSAGVDIFFVISGFIMLYTTWSWAQGGPSVRTFFLRRLIRIAPLYWLATTFLLLLWTTGLVSRSEARPLDDVILSYLFLPVFNAEGAMRPLLGVGWTLVFEMFFYLCFGLSLFLPRKHRTKAVSATMIGLVIIGALLPFPTKSTWLEVYTSPMLIEFMLGVWIAWLTLNRPGPTRRWIPAATLVIGSAWLLTCTSLVAGSKYSFLLATGLPAALIVWSVLQFETSSTRWAKSPLLEKLGDASYSIYLIHPIILIGCSFIWRRAFHGSLDNLISFLLVLPLVGIIGVLCFQIAEKPTTRFLNKKLVGRIAKA